MTCMQVQGDAYLFSSCGVCKLHKDRTFEVLAVEVSPQSDTVYLKADLMMTWHLPLH